MAKTKKKAHVSCAAGFACKAPESADLDGSSHSCCGCGQKVHSALWCGKSLATLLNEQPYLVGRALPSGRVLHCMGADNEMHCVCFTCIGKLPTAGYDEDSNNEGKGTTLRNTDSEEESSSSSDDDNNSNEGIGKVGGPPAGNQQNAATGKQLN